MDLWGYILCTHYNCLYECCALSRHVFTNLKEALSCFLPYKVSPLKKKLFIKFYFSNGWGASLVCFSISADAICLASYTSSMHAVMYNPAEPRLLATANAKEGLGLWDVRKPKR